MKVIGIDPSEKATAWAYRNENNRIVTGAAPFPAKDDFEANYACHLFQAVIGQASKSGAQKLVIEDGFCKRNIAAYGRGCSLRAYLKKIAWDHGLLTEDVQPKVWRKLFGWANAKSVDAKELACAHARDLGVKSADTHDKAEAVCIMLWGESNDGQGDDDSAGSMLGS
jgi:hypothetical protein